jgi:hypothetical protein
MWRNIFMDSILLGKLIFDILVPAGRSRGPGFLVLEIEVNVRNLGGRGVFIHHVPG